MYSNAGHVENAQPVCYEHETKTTDYQHQHKDKIDKSAENLRISQAEKENKQLSYTYFSNSAKDTRQVAVANNNQSSRNCCDTYKEILDKLETLCRWRDEFVAKKKQMSRAGCVLCERGTLKSCNFCEYHDSMVKGGGPRFEDSLTDSDTDLQRELPERRPYKALEDRPTPQVTAEAVSRYQKKEDQRQDIPLSKISVTQRDSSFINFDDIPLPTQRKSMDQVTAGSTRIAAEGWQDNPSSRTRLNEMKKVEWKWDVSKRNV